MPLFSSLLLKLIPLYILILLGFIAGRKLSVKTENLAKLLIYIITPVVVFQGVIATNLNGKIFALPLLMFLMSAGICLAFYKITGYIYKDNSKNILAFASATGNTGYFGLPVALALFGESALGPMVLGILGVVLFENTIGFYITARGHHTAKEALLKVVKLPSLYAFILGVIINLTNISLGSSYEALALNFRGAYSVLGMMIIGLALSALESFKIDFKFTGLAFLGKFLVWPALIFLFIALDKSFFHIFEPFLHNILTLLSIVPIAANTVAYASALNVQPEKTATTVLLSTLFALFYIPLIVGFMIK